MSTTIQTVQSSVNLQSIRFLPYPSPDRDPRSAMLGSKAESSRRKYRESLVVILGLFVQLPTVNPGDDVLDLVPLRWESISPAHVGMVRQALSGQFARSTVNRHLSALRSLMKSCWNMGLIDHETYQRFVDETKAKRVNRPKFDTGRLVTDEEFQMMLETCDGSPLGFRDAAILSIMFFAGLRRSEVVDLDLDQYDRTGRVLVSVKGKGDKVREVPIPVNARLAVRLNSWLAVRGSEPGPLFQAVRRGGHVQPGRMSSQAIYNVVKGRADQAGLDADSIVAHDFRRTFTTNALDASEGNTVLVSDLVGHSNPATTARYNRAGLAAYRDLIDRM